MKFLKFAGAAAVVAALAFSATAQDLKSFVGKPAPAFKMTDTSGKTHTNQSLRGKVVLLDFWATWCGPCKAASPTMQKLHQKYAGQGLVVVGANTFERGDGNAASKKYASEHNYSYMFTHGNDAFARSLGVRGIPAFVFIDKKGVVREAKTGWNDKTSPAEFEKIVAQLLRS